MPSMQYQRDGSIVVTNDAGKTIIVPRGSQAEQDAAVQVHVGPPVAEPPSVDEKLAALTALLVNKGVATAKEISDATSIDAVALDLTAVPLLRG